MEQVQTFWQQAISQEIFQKKYNLYEESETEVFRNIAKEIASPEKEDVRSYWEEVFFNLISSTQFIPAGRILANARPFSKLKNYNNCFTIDVQDDMSLIYEALKEDAQISKMGGGVGFNVSKLRPEGDILSRGGEASGPLSFLKVFNESAKIIMTGGQRRAAHIAIMNINHPDVEKFITAKQGDTNGALTQFNISVGITDDFMQAVDDDKDWDLTFNGKVYKTVKARDLYNKLVENAYEHNEPGIFNLDHVNNFNNGWYMYDIQEVNPCGEQPIPAYNVCDLGAMNLTKFVHNAFTEKAYFDFENFYKSIYNSVRFLDNVLDATDYPLEKIREQAQANRRVGLGFTGLADTFVMLGIKYGSNESKYLSEEIGKALRDYSYKSSVEIAKEKGPFSNYKEDFLKSNFVKTLDKELRDDIKKYGIRNINLNTVAPTGTTSFSLGQNCSSGIEPIFSLQYDRKIRTGRGDETTTETVYDYAWLLYQEITGNTEAPDTFVTTMDVDPYDAIDIQAIFQKYVDASISKTANLPPGYTFEQYKELFRYAYRNGLKGFTSFNPDGSMAGILSYSKDEKKEEVKSEPTKLRPDYIDRGHAPKRPEDLECDIHQISVNKEKHIVLIGKLNGSLYEVFVTPKADKIDVDNHKTGIIRKEKKGHYTLIVKNGVEKNVVDNIGETFDPTYASLSRFISMSLRHGVPLQFIVDQLQKDTNFVSFEKAVSRVLKKYIKEGEKVMTNQKCPECESELVYGGGCVTCTSCGWSQCS